MKTIQQHITERLQLTRDRVHKIEYNYFPETLQELREIIKEQLNKNENANLNNINISKINIFVDKTRGSYRDRGLFEELDPHHIDISQWNVSHVKDMSRLFFGCRNLVCDVSSWNVSNVQTMSNMFMDCYKFDCDLSNWDIKNCENLFGMFVRCYEFTGQGLDNWDVSHVTSFAHMFNGCKKINVDLNNWDIRSKTEFHYMFKDCDTLEKNNLIPDWYTWKKP
jgi:surface protein